MIPKFPKVFVKNQKFDSASGLIVQIWDHFLNKA